MSRYMYTDVECALIYFLVHVKVSIFFSNDSMISRYTCMELVCFSCVKHDDGNNK